jgi:hypothetical protein
MDERIDYNGLEPSLSMYVCKLVGLVDAELRRQRTVCGFPSDF